MNNIERLRRSRGAHTVEEALERAEGWLAPELEKET